MAVARAISLHLRTTPEDEAASGFGAWRHTLSTTRLVNKDLLRGPMVCTRSLI